MFDTSAALQLLICEGGSQHYYENADLSANGFAIAPATRGARSEPSAERGSATLCA